MLGSIAYRLHVLFQRVTEPVRYARARYAMRKLLAPLDRQEAEARRRHRQVEPIRAAKRALVNDALRRVA